ncbi:MAG: DUF1385 domain-containing protein, partial [Oscillospiraceae bacterium]
RIPDDTIDTEYIEAPSLIKKHKWLNIPIIRGCINMVEQMIFSTKCLYKSAEKSGLALEEEVEESSKFEKWIDKVFGDKLFGFIMSIGMVLGVALSVVLFIYLPMIVVKGIETATISFFNFELGMFKNVIEGVIKLAIFIAYLALVSNMKDIKRTFEYHGAEHKTIACFEAGEELTPANARKFKRFHPRCGTSFMFIILILSIIISSFISWDNMIIRFLLKFAVIPVVVGLGYELIKLAGKYDNIVTRTFSAPGMWMQRLTTKEPDDKQLEVAISAMLAVIPDENNKVL